MLMLATAMAQPVTPVLPEGFRAIGLAPEGPRAGGIMGYLVRPPGDKPVPAVVALHGCGGLFGKTGQLAKREADWARRLVAAGYAVLFPDSFNPRGYRQICSIASADRPIRPQHRAHDAAAAVAWLSSAPDIDRNRLALIGWSHGGSSTLWAVRGGFTFPGAEIKAAVAFYPGCRVPSERADWSTRVPLTILIGDADDWTSPVTCRALAKRPGVRLIEYPGAVHGFDAPDSPRRTRGNVGMSSTGRSTAQVGTDPAARAAAISEVTRILAEAFRP